MQREEKRNEAQQGAVQKVQITEKSISQLKSSSRLHLHMSARGTLKISDDFWASPKPFFLARPATTGL